MILGVLKRRTIYFYFFYDECFINARSDIPAWLCVYYIRISYRHIYINLYLTLSCVVLAFTLNANRKFACVIALKTCRRDAFRHTLINRSRSRWGDWSPRRLLCVRVSTLLLWFCELRVSPDYGQAKVRRTYLTPTSEYIFSFYWGLHRVEWFKNNDFLYPLVIGRVSKKKINI